MSPKTPGVPPDDAALGAALGKARTLWDSALAHAASAQPGCTTEWKRYGASPSWWCRVLHRKRALFSLVLADEGFDAVFILGERAVELSRTRPLPPDIRTKIDEARPYLEGRGIRFPVKRTADLATIKALLEIKLLC